MHKPMMEPALRSLPTAGLEKRNTSSKVMPRQPDRAYLRDRRQRVRGGGRHGRQLRVCVPVLGRKVNKRVEMRRQSHVLVLGILRPK